MAKRKAEIPQDLMDRLGIMTDDEVLAVHDWTHWFMESRMEFYGAEEVETETVIAANAALRATGEQDDTLDARLAEARAAIAEQPPAMRVQLAAYFRAGEQDGGGSDG